MTAVLRTLSSSHLTGRAGRLRLLHITPAQKNPELFHDFQPTPELRGLLFLYKGISNGTGEDRTWTHLLCFTWQHTQARALLVCTPAIVAGPTEIRQNLSQHFHYEYWEREVQEKRAAGSQSNNAGNMCVGSQRALKPLLFLSSWCESTFQARWHSLSWHWVNRTLAQRTSAVI